MNVVSLEDDASNVMLSALPANYSMSHKIDLIKLKASGVLPSPEGVALTVIRMCERDNLSLSELARVIQGDPVLAGRIIKIANSCKFAYNPNKFRPVASVTTETLISIGINAVRQTTLAFSFISDHQKGSCSGFNYREFWSRSTSMASAMLAIGACVQVAPLSELFTCGLIAQIGQLCLASARPEEYTGLLGRYGCHPSEALTQAETDFFGMNHNDLTLEMMTDWGFPRLFIDSVFHHEDPERSSFAAGSRLSKLTYTFHLASLMGRICLADETDRAALLPAVFQSAEVLGLDVETTVGIANQAIEEWRKWGELLGIKPQGIPVKPLLMPGGDVIAPTEDAKHHTAIAQIESLRILIADPDEALNAMLNKLFSNAGHIVYTTQSGRLAVQLALEKQPHIIMTDWNMPEVNTEAMCRILRGKPGLNKTYFVLLTEREEQYAKIEAKKAGMDAYIHKPINRKMLNDVLLAALHRFTDKPI